MNFPFLREKERLIRIMGTFDLATGHADTFDELLDSLESELRDVLGHYREALAQPAQEPDALTIAYQSGFYDGKKAAQRPWVGLTEKDFSAINQSCLTKLQAATSAESILKEKNS